MSETLSFNLIGDVSASEWGGMSQEEQEAVIESRFEGLSPSQIGEIRDTILRTIEQYKEVIKEYRDDLRIEARGRRGAEERAAEASELLREIDDLKLTLTDFEGDLQLVAADEITQFQTHHRDHSGDDEFAVSQYEMGGPGDDPAENTYTSTLRPRGILLGDETATRDDTQYLREEEVVNEEGEVIKDVKPDGILNYADIEEALRQKNDPLVRQKVFFLLKPDHTLSLERYNPEAGEVVFKVADPEGNFAYFEFENLSPETVFSFSSGVTEADFRSWPEPFLNQCRVTQPDGSPSEDTVYDILFGIEVPEEDKLEVIPHYTDVREGLSAVSSYADHSLTEEEQEVAAEIMDRLFGYLDRGDPSLDRLIAVWEEIDESLRGFGEKRRSIILQHVIFSFAIKAPTYLPQLFGPVAGRLENALQGTVEPTAAAKLAILLLETKAGAGSYGGETIWNQLFPDPAVGGSGTGTWQGEGSRESSLKALQDYQTIVTSHMDGVLDSRFNSILTYVKTGKDPLAAEDPSSPSTEGTSTFARDPTEHDRKFINVPDSVCDEVLDDPLSFAQWMSTDEESDPNLRTSLVEFFTALKAQGEMTVTELRQYLLGQLTGRGAEFICGVIVILYTNENSLPYKFWTDLMAGTNGRRWAEEIYMLIYTNQDAPLFETAHAALGGDFATE